MNATIRSMMVNFEDTYGADGLPRLIRMIREGRTLKSIATTFGVTRQRILQWREAFGEHSVTVRYVLHDAVVQEIGDSFQPLQLTKREVDDE